MLDILSSLKMILLEHKAAFFLAVLIASYPYIKKLDKKLKADKIKRKENYKIINQIHISTIPDAPKSFGYKTCWIAVKEDKTNDLLKNLTLKDFKSANWETGLDAAYKEWNKNIIFITPVVEGWTLIVGVALEPYFGYYHDSLLEKIKTNVFNMPDFYYFASHRVTDYSSWMTVKDGKIKRAFSYVGDKGEYYDYGEKTEEELKMGVIFFDYDFVPDDGDDSYFDRDDLTYPDEDHVLKMAEQWSINPLNLEQYSKNKDLGRVAVLSINV